VIKLATNLSRFYSLRSKSAQENPYWAGFKSFLSGVAEPFSGAAHYWTGGRIGSDYPEDSMWIDTNRRLLNALPGRTQYELQYKDPLLDAAAASLGVSTLAAGAAGATLAAPYAVPAAKSFLTAAPRAREAVGLAARLGEYTKTLGGPLVAATAPKVIQDAANVAIPAIHNINQYEADATKKLLEAGYSQVDAERIANKIGWGGMMHAGKEYLTSPYYYMYRGGGDNPIDRTFVDMMGSPKPYDAFTAARQGLSVAASGPIGAGVKTLGYGALNQLESMPSATSATMNEAQRQISQPNYQIPTLSSARNVLDNSRMYQSMRNYYGDDFGPIATHLGFNTLNRATAYPTQNAASIPPNTNRPTDTNLRAQSPTPTTPTTPTNS
jgi:hypothetical protein